MSGVLAALCVTGITSWGVPYWAFRVLAATTAALAGALGGYPAMFAVLTAIAALAAILAAGTAPSPVPPAAGVPVRDVSG